MVPRKGLFNPETESGAYELSMGVYHYHTRKRLRLETEHKAYPVKKNAWVFSKPIVLYHP